MTSAVWRMTRRFVPIAFPALCAALFMVGYAWGQSTLMALAAAVFVGVNYGFRRRRNRPPGKSLEELAQALPVSKPESESAGQKDYSNELAHPGNDDERAQLVRQMLAQGRHTLLLRPQIAPSLNEDQLSLTLAALEDQMALVPSGEVVVGAIDGALDEGKIDVASLAQYHARTVKVAPLFLDRYSVTNRKYHEFVSGGGYESMAIWDEEIWPAVLDFVDQTGHPGPKYWRDGMYPPGEEYHPVIGVSWYEAVAYARWAGKRLPTEAEWVKAGGWPVSPVAGMWLQRKYPWGNTFDLQRANLWSSNVGHIVPVDQYDDGVSTGGVYQLVGNVWEWTSGNFGHKGDATLTLPVPMKSIRGGAYDTYYENQATCNFQSGESPLARKHNVGFRLAIGVCDLSPLVIRQLGPNEEVEEAEPDEVCA